MAAAVAQQTEARIGERREMWLQQGTFPVSQVTAQKHLGNEWWVGICLHAEGEDLFRTREEALRSYLLRLLEYDKMIRRKIGQIRAELTESEPRAGCPLCLEPLDGDHDTLNCAIAQRAEHLREALTRVGVTRHQLLDLDTKMETIGRIATEALARDEVGWEF